MDARILAFNLLLLAAPFPLATANGAPPEGQPPVAETKDRISEARSRALVAGPLDEILKGDVARGEADFETLVKRRTGRTPKSRILVADTLSAMGVELYAGAPDADDATLKIKSLEYLDRAVAAMREAFGPDDPETALAMTDYVQVALKVFPDDPPTQVDAYAAESYRIRLARLGAANGETIGSLADLARLEGLKTRARGDPARIDRAAADFARAADLAREAPAINAMEFCGFLIDRASLLVANGRIDEGLKTFAASDDEANAEGPNGERPLRFAFDIQASRFADALEAAGRVDDAKAVRAHHKVDLKDFLANVKGELTVNPSEQPASSPPH